MGQLRLDSKALALSGGISGKVIVPGNSAQSTLIQRIQGTGGAVRMPIQGSPLTSDQIALIRRWVDEGAAWPDDASVSGAALTRHWAYEKPVRPALPAVSNLAWVRNPIDRFVLARLDREGLTPSPEASRETLIRRVSLDLTGLPPSPEEIDAFLADRAPNAYEKLVDRLLASPHYGEQRARPWLDLARYADTNGFADNRRSIWKYRDWVIGAFNRDLPYDQFSIEQLAGDMLPGATLDQKIATGFHRNTMFNDEGGIDQDEAQWIINVDRAATTSTVWLGSTLGCAQCHNHKYDPFTQKDFYGLLAFFETVDYKVEGKGWQKLYVEPVLELPTKAQATEQTYLRAEIAKRESLLTTSTPELEQAQTRWESEEAPKQARWRIIETVERSCAGAASLRKSPDHSLTLTPAQDRDDCAVVVATSLASGSQVQAEMLSETCAIEPRLEADTRIRLKALRKKPGPCRFQLSTAAAGAPLAPPLPDAIRSIWEAAHRTPEQSGQLAAYYRSIAPSLKPTRDQLAELKERLAKLPIVTTLTLGERPEAGKRTTYLRIRGSYLSKGEAVDAASPRIFHSAEPPRDRLALARWLVSDQNPLAARVAVNRFWEQIFGRGIVETVDDFGSRGSAPTHPELLDWLAVEFVNQGWSIKTLHRLIVTSAAYRQASTVTPALFEKDPDNRLLARGSRFRLDAETLRDAALSASGLLERDIGGPPVFPYQPDGVWNAPYYKENQWVNSAGPNAYRRGIYTYWRRTAPYASFVNFDAPSREFCAARRMRTNTPLQALTTLNDPAFFAAAQALARRLLGANGDPRDRAALGFRLCVARRPTQNEIDHILTLFSQQLLRFTADPQSAQQLTGETKATSPELAAWTVVANVLLNLDEALTKE